MKIHLSILLAVLIMLQPASYAGDAPAVTGSAYVTQANNDSIILRDLTHQQPPRPAPRGG